LLVLGLAGCNEQDLSASAAKSVAAPGMGQLAERAPAAPTVATADAVTEAPQHIAERQDWVLELPAPKLEAVWRAHVNSCTGPCQVLHAEASQAERGLPSAWLELRIPRDGLGGLVHRLETSGKVTNRSVSREDRTLQVVDVEARVQSLTDLRQRLRTLLAERPGKLGELLELERELTRVQGELDALRAQRAVLALETEKVTLSVRYQAPETVLRPGAWQPLAEAWQQTSTVLAQSLAGLLKTTVFAVPWLVLTGGVLWLVGRVSRRKQR
jgi:hypothetical protein